MIATNRIRLLALALVVLPQACLMHVSQEVAKPYAAPLVDIKVSFKLDPRLTQGQYMGDSWISSPSYTSTVKAGNELTVEARAEGLEKSGKLVEIKSEWLPDDPGMVAVSPGQGNTVMITVKRAGQSGLRVLGRGFSKKLLVKSVYRENTVQVVISQ